MTAKSIPETIELLVPIDVVLNHLQRSGDEQAQSSRFASYAEGDRVFCIDAVPIVAETDAGYEVCYRCWAEMPAVQRAEPLPPIRVQLTPLEVGARVEVTRGHPAFDAPYHAVLGNMRELQLFAQRQIALYQANQANNIDELPKKPPIPGADSATWDDVFDWYYNVPRSVCGDLRELAKMILAAPGTVRNRHAEYQAQHNDKMSSTG